MKTNDIYMNIACESKYDKVETLNENSRQICPKRHIYNLLATFIIPFIAKILF